MPNKRRISVHVTQAIAERIEALAERTGGDSLASTFRHALALYEELAKIKEEGSEILIKTKSGETQRLVIL